MPAPSPAAAGGCSAGLLRLHAHDEGIAGVDPVGVTDVRVLLPELRPEIRVAQELLRQRPQGVARLDDVHLGIGRELGRGVVGRPVVTDLVEWTRGRADRLLRCSPADTQCDENRDGCAAHGSSPLPHRCAYSAPKIPHHWHVRQCLTAQKVVRCVTEQVAQGPAPMLVPGSPGSGARQSGLRPDCLDLLQERLRVAGRLGVRVVQEEVVEPLPGAFPGQGQRVVPGDLELVLGEVLLASRVQLAGLLGLRRVGEELRSPGGTPRRPRAPV